MSLLLTSEERAKFAAWLRQDAESDRIILRQMQHLSGDAVKVFPGLKPIMDKKEMEITAKMRVARILESIESQTVS